MQDLDMDGSPGIVGSASTAHMRQEYSSTGSKNWMNFGGSGRAPMERPTTASQNNARVAELEKELRNERRDQKRLLDEIESLKKEIHKSNFSSFKANSGEISVTAGRLPMVPGVREIQLTDLEIGQQIG